MRFSLLQVLRVQVDVRDVNDNAPQFQNDAVDVSFSESAAVGTSRILPQARDVDSPQFGVVSYVMTPASAGVFALTSPSENEDGNLKLVVRGRLDREAQQTYTFQVRKSTLFAATST